MKPLDPNTPVLEIPPGLADRPILDPKLANPPTVPRLAGGKLPAAQPTWDLNTELFKFGNKYPFTIRHGCAGVIVFGETGSGKSTGPGNLIRLNYLKHGFGFLVLCFKPEEASDWVECARIAGRERDVIRITTAPDCRYRCDFLAHEMAQPGSDTMTSVLQIQNVSDVLRNKPGGGGSNDEFWIASSNKVIKNAIDLYKLAYVWGPLLKEQGLLPANEWVPEYKPTLLFIMELITSAVTNAEDLDSPTAIERSLNLRCLELAGKVAQVFAASKAPESAEQVKTFKLTNKFWRTEWAKDGLGDSRLRDNIIAFAESTMQPLERGVVANLFQRRSRLNPETGREEYYDSVTPDMVDEGKIIIVDVPVKIHKEAGQLAGAIWKDLVQRYADRRTGRTDRLVNDARAKFQPAVDAAKRKLAALPPESFAERNLPGFLQFGPRRAALDECAYAQGKLDYEVKRAKDSVRPIVIWVDEYQKFTVRGDADFQAAARSGRTLVVYLTQNTPCLDDVVGEARRKALVGNMNTKILCKNSDPSTNQWASDAVGKKFKTKKSRGKTYPNPFALIPSVSLSTSTVIEEEVPAGKFTTLKNGDLPNGCKVEAFVIGADMFRPGVSCIKTLFDQNYGSSKLVVSEKIKARARARIRREAE